MNTPLTSSTSSFNARQALDYVTRQQDGDIVDHGARHIAIPAKSPAFNADWSANDHIDAAVNGWNAPTAAS